VSQPGQGVVFVADGSCALTNAGTNLETVIQEANLCLRIERVNWSHGRYRPLSDLLTHSHHRACGEQLATQVLAQRQADPDAPIFLVAHSAGAAVVLAAAECLPVGTVERIILLAPAVSCTYDLVPALRCSRQGIDSFYSKHDQVLSTFVVVCGTADRSWQPSAGWLGFDAPAESCTKLRQYPWSSDLISTGYYGGHYGCRTVGHLRERVVPLLIAMPPSPGEETPIITEEQSQPAVECVVAPAALRPAQLPGRERN
jgi:hypothetical protein